MSKTESSEIVACVHPNAGGLDIGAREIWVAVPPDRPHRIQLLTPTARLIDTFTPLRRDFL